MERISVVFIFQLNCQIVHDGSSLKFYFSSTETTQKWWTLISYAFQAISIWTHGGEAKLAR